MAHKSEIDAAVKQLQKGELIGLPTETVYGLAGDAANPDAVSKIYALKERPHFNPLIAHVCDLDMAAKQANFCDTSKRLAKAFWPGPLTLVLPVAETSSVCDLARAGLDTQALRMPDHALALTIIERFGAPIVAPSANKSGRISPTSAAHVRAEFGNALEVVIDGGETVLGLESTVLAVINDGVTLLRPGALSRDDVEKLVGPIKTASTDNTAPRSPGMLSRHYAPNARLRLNADQPEADEAFLAFGPTALSATMNLSQSGDLREAAANLYAMLRTLDAKFDAIAVAPIPQDGLGEAINDRLNRARL